MAKALVPGGLTDDSASCGKTWMMGETGSVREGTAGIPGYRMGKMGVGQGAKP
jgi:hypothetical protein